MHKPKTYPRYLYILASEFLPGFPTILFPFGDRDLPWIKVTHRTDGLVDIRNARSNVTALKDDTIRYQVSEGRLLLMSGPSRHTKPFQKIVADTTIDISCLKTQQDQGISYNRFDCVPKIFGKEISHSHEKGLIEKYEVAVIVDKNGYGSIRGIFTAKGAELEPKNLMFLREVTEKYKRQPSGAFKFYAQELLPTQAAPEHQPVRASL